MAVAMLVGNSDVDSGVGLVGVSTGVPGTHRLVGVSMLVVRLAWLDRRILPVAELVGGGGQGKRCCRVAW